MLHFLVTYLDAVWVTDDGVKRRSTKVKHFFIYLEKA